jgi:hypothetical protein
MRCTAKSKRSGEQCRRHATRGREVCRMHGGATPRGMASPHWRGRGYSKDLPTRLYERWEAGLNDPKLLELHSEIALIDARLGEMFVRRPRSMKQWREVYRLIDLRRKVTHAENRRQAFLETHLTAEQAAALFGALVGLLQYEAEDVRDRISRGMQGIIMGHAPDLAPPPVAVIEAPRE